jgi:hypothetical protein
MADRKIAIIFSDEQWDDREESYRKIIEHITEWTLVTQEEFQLLHDYQWQKGYKLIEFPMNHEVFVRETVASLLLEVKQKQEEAERKKAQRKAAIEANRVKNEAAAREKKLEQLAKLQRELGLVSNASKEVS